jgi:ribose transport system permease protein
VSLGKVSTQSSHSNIWLNWRPSQETIVFIGAIVAFTIFSIFIDGFFSYANVIVLLRTVATLGILAIGMTIVVLSRGIDLSQIANMAIFSAWVIQLMNQGLPIGVALGLGLAAALIFGALNGFLVAFVEIPALFVTLASGSLLFGIGQAIVLKDMVATVHQERSPFFLIGEGSVFHVPVQILLFVGLAIVFHLLLSRTSIGRFIYAHGDNLETARITGLDVRSLTVLEYIISAAIAFVAGVVASATVGSMDTQVFYSSRIFDVILVVVLGGVSLIGARGSVWSIVVGTVLYGILLNGMTLMNLNADVQDLIKGFVLMFALLADNFLHPRDEETARQGDL